MQVLNNLNNVNFNESDDESNLKTVCKNLVRSTTSAHKTCFPERNAHTSFHKTWWTQELSDLSKCYQHTSKYGRNMVFQKMNKTFIITDTL